MINFMDLDPVLLSRIQFAFTISFHIIFPAFTIGLSGFLAVTEGIWLKTGKKIYKEIYHFWIKIFAVCFGIGVVTGVVMSYQFGTNWSSFSDITGSVIGPLLGYEVLTAFFLEASFLGIMLFGWGRVSDKMHFASTVIVAVGTSISAFWIISVNSWMQTPQGFGVDAQGLFYPISWIEIIFNPSFGYRFVHMLTAAYLTTSFMIGGVGAWYLLKKLHVKHARIMLGMAMIMALFVAPFQILVGDAHGLNTIEHQPSKIAAMEGLWDTQKGAPLVLFAIPDEENETNKFEIAIPKLSSLILTHNLDGEVKGLKDWPRAERPPVTVVFFAFRIMVAIGLLMTLTGIIALFLFLRKRLFDTKWFQMWCVAMAPSGFIAVLAGWFVTEVGRQPYTVFGVLKTADSSSPVLGEYVAISLLAFIVVYMLLLISALVYTSKLVRKGPDHDDNIYGDHGLHGLHEPSKDDNKSEEKE